MSTDLPPGQRERSDFPRFGLTPYARRFPKETQQVRLQLRGLSDAAIELDDPLRGLPRVEQVSDFHCVTTWSRRRLRWGGVRFADFYRARVEPQVGAGRVVRGVVLRAQDGLRTALPLEDLLADDVLLADRLDGEPLSIAHGAPLRLVAPAHYGYKSVKHLSSLEPRDEEAPTVRRGFWAFMDHPRARVAQEERGRGAPGWMLRWVYRPMIGPNVRWFERTMRQRPES